MVFTDNATALTSRKGWEVGRYLLNWTILAIVLVGISFFMFSSFAYRFQWHRLWDFRALFLKGFFNTIVIAVFSLILSLCVGFLAGMARSSRVLFLRICSAFYIEVIRNTPLLVQILLFFYVGANAVGFQNRYIAGILIMSCFAGAYMAEIVRSGIESIETKQLESAASLGLTRGQVYRYVIFPQIIRRIIPPLTGQLVSLIKDSSLLSIISVREFTMVAREVTSVSYLNLESYFLLAIGYMCMTYPISFIARRLERRFDIYTHRSRD